MDEERKDGALDDRRKIRFNPVPTGNIFSNFTESRFEAKSQPSVGKFDQEGR